MASTYRRSSTSSRARARAAPASAVSTRRPSSVSRKLRSSPRDHAARRTGRRPACSHASRPSSPCPRSASMPATIVGRVLEGRRRRRPSCRRRRRAARRRATRANVMTSRSLLGLPVDELLLERDRGDEAAGAAAPSRSSRRRSSRASAERYIATACDASWIATAWRSQSAYFQSSAGPLFLRCFALSDVGVLDGVASVADRDDERLVHDVLDRGAGRVRRHRSRASRPRSGVSECFTLSR